uniref:Splicing factor U2af large subunit n=1 Tax=Oryza glumipatula TaxID=40148 RepID=A0A0E0BM76_9ORYZ
MADDHAAAADLVNGGRPETDYQNQEIKIEKEKKTRTGNATGTVTEIEEETEIGTRTRKKTETKKGTGIGTGTRIGIATIGITVKEENTEIALMIMIATEAVILKGEETMNGMGVAGIGLAHALVLGAGIADLGLALVQKASELVDLIWRLQLKLWFHNFLLFQPQFPGTAIPGMFPNMLPMGVGQFNPLVIQPQAMTQQATRHARRVYVGGLPPTANEQSVAIYFNQVMAAIGGNTAGPGDAVLNVYINHDKKFAFVEMRSVEEASNAMALDGILGSSEVGLTPGSAGGLEGPDRIFVGGLPYYFTEAQVRELLESFGPLRGFDLVKDRETGNSKGYAFCVYQDLNVTDIACAALNGIKMGDKTLTVRRANQGAAQPRPEQESILLQAQQQVQLQKLVYQVGALPTKVVCLTQVVSADELKDDEEYEDIMEDMRLEAGKYGNLIKVVIPRPDPSGLPVAGVGKVFLEYADVDGATKAKTAMHGRKFGGNPVVAVFYPENKFASAEYDA